VLLKDVVPAMNQKLTKTFQQYLGYFAETVIVYFKEADVSKFECVRNPFVASTVSGLTTCEPEQLIARPVTCWMQISILSFGCF
jgi:hypothetical protein